MPCRSAALGTLLVVSGCVSSHQAPPAFDASRAFGFLEAQCRLGPRVPGTDAHRAGRDFIETEFRRHSKLVQVHEFTGPGGWGGELTGWNIVAEFGRGEPVILIGAHWDSRMRADQDPDPDKRLEPVPAANDGASGVAVLLELARIFEAAPPPRRVLLACFDLEDQGRADDPNGFCLGSKALAREMPAPGSSAEAIVLDMVGGKGMELRPEGYSRDLSAGLVRELWRLGRALESRAFAHPDSVGGYVTDDHLPFLRAGWQAVDLIDMRYPQWHTTHDLPSACDPQSLAAVGEVVRHHVYRIEPGRR